MLTALEEQLVEIEPGLIDDNPYQPRLRMDPAKLKELADSIREHGLQSQPKVRQVGKRYQLLFGHRRLRAWKSARPGEPFPCILVMATDQQMAERAAIENGQREDLNPIERARGLRLLCAPPFNLTQAAAGKLYGLVTQGAVSNAMRLLELPDKIQKLVVNGELIEKHARELVFVARVDAAEAVEIAQAVVDCQLDDEEPSQELTDQLELFFQKHGKRMDCELWPLDWKPAELSVKPKGEPAFDAPACSDCSYFRKGHWENYCARPVCLAAKLKARAELEADRVSKKLKIPRPKDGEQVGKLWSGVWEDKDWALGLVKSKAKHLRLLPNPARTNGWQLKEHLGSSWVMLGTTDLQIIEKRKKDKAARAQQERNRYQPKTKEEQAAEQAEHNRRLQIGRALVISAAKHLATALPANAGLLLLLAQIEDNWWERDALTEIRQATQPNLRRELLMRLLLRSMNDVYKMRAPTPDKLRAALAKTAAEIKVRLPAGWDAIPEEQQPKPAANGKSAQPAAKAKPKGKGRK